MVFAKQILAAFAAVATVSAQSSSSSSCSSITIQNQGDATKLSSCSSVNGDVTINAQAGTSLDFGTNLKKISGKIAMSNDTQIQTLSFNSLQQLGSLELKDLTRLNTLNLGALASIGDLDLVNLGTLNNFNFGQGLQSASNVHIENVQISDLSGVASAKMIESVVLYNNQYLSNIMFNFTEVGIIEVGANNYAQGQQVSFPSLTTATSITVRNSTSVSTPMLRNVSETLSLIGNTFTSYNVPNLTWAGAIVLEDNSKVTNFSFPSLLKINNSDNATLSFQNNSQFTNVNGFPKLNEIKGAATFYGAIKNISLPSIQTVAGAFRIDTSAQFDCPSFQSYSSNGTVKGEFTCTGGDATPQGSSGNSGSGSDSSGSGGKSAAVGLQIPAILTTGVFAFIVALLV